MNHGEKGIFLDTASPIGRQVKRAQTFCENFSYPFFQPGVCRSFIDATLFSVRWCQTP
jgi:hypothetical protein